MSIQESALGDDPSRSWRACLRSSHHRTRLGIHLLILLIIVSGFSRFLEFVEHRSGVVLADPVLALFSPADVTWLTFGLIYVALILAVGVLAKEPGLLLRGIQSYAIMVLIRTLLMFLVPLDPPPTMIPLHDPLVELAVGKGAVLTRDLFFSGHTSTMFLFSLLAPTRTLKKVFIICTVLVGACVLLQHVHYTIDVIVAPVFAYIAVRINQMIPG